MDIFGRKRIAELEKELKQHVLLADERDTEETMKIIDLEADNAALRDQIDSLRPLVPGDTVRLKSGGPLMTVSSVGKSGDVFCTWHVGTMFDYDHAGNRDKDDYRVASFKAALLERGQSEQMI